MALGRLTTAINQGLFRSALTGQANAILLQPELRAVGEDSIVLNPLAFRRRISRELHLSRRMRAKWAKERRVCQAVRTEGLTVANLHATGLPGWLVADSELLRAAVFADSVAEPGRRARAGRRLQRHPRALDDAAAARGVGVLEADLLDRPGARPRRRTGHAHRWPDERRRVDGRLLSDHAPVEVTIE